MVLLVVLEQMVPKHMLAQNLWIPNNYHTELCSGKSYIQPSWICQESYSLVLVASHTRDDDDVLLSPLESVHTGNFNVLV